VFRSDRLPFLGATVLAAVFLSQAFRLEDYSPFGPGPGIFPQIATVFATALALLLLLVPFLSHDSDQPPAPPEEIGPEEQRVFRLYMAGFLLLVVGSAWLGFLVTSVLVALLLCWRAERRSLRDSLLFGLACGLIGTVGLGYYLQIEVPYALADSLLMRLIR